MSQLVKPRFESLLVVDDNEMNRELLRRRLEEVGYLVTTIDSGRGALNRMQHETYDLVLLDIMMPDMDGFQVLSEMKNHEKMRRIPVMMVTAVNDMENVVKCIGMGARDYVAKPFDPTLLKARVARLLEKYPTSQPVSTAPATTRKDIRVLLVDDEALNRELVGSQLTRLGYLPEHAGSGGEALKMLATNTYDCVLLDIMMPDMDGFHVLEKIRSTEATKNLPVVMLSALDDQETISRCTKSGATDYLTKPFHSAILNVRIRNALTGDKTAARSSVDKKSRVIADVKKKMLSNTLALPIVSDVGTTVTQLCLLPDVNLKELTDVISLDPSLTAKLLAVANSSAYKGVKRAETLNEAITRIGLSETKRFAAAMASKSAYQGGLTITARIAEKVWHHSVAVGLSAREIAEERALGDVERLYTMGLLHDIGVAVVLRVVDEEYAGDAELTESLVNEIALAVHAEVGAYVCERWRMPEEYSTAIRLHHTDDFTRTPVQVNVLALAHLCASQLGTGYGEPEVVAEVGKAIRAQMQISDEVWGAVVARVREKVGNIKSLL